MDLTPNEVELRQLIAQAQDGNDEALLVLIERFKPLRYALRRHWGRRISRHSQGIEWDDLVQEIDLHFIAAVKKYDPKIEPHPVKYLANATRAGVWVFYRHRVFVWTPDGMRPKATALSFEEYQDWALVAGATVNMDVLLELRGFLTDLQYLILTGLANGKTEQELANELNCSHQAISRTKIRALARMGVAKRPPSCNLSYESCFKGVAP